jgi:DNA (cytosine-5)-methyltransferase 1
MTHGSLFSGIGGFDLAAEWAGWTNAFHCEWNEFGQKVLKYYWPNAESFIDITKTNFSKYEKKIDVLTGGFPCQPYSLAGKRRGKDDERHLWPEMCRAIREIKPRWIVGENVFGLVNWSDGLVFHEVQADLENEGYEVQSFLLPAAAVNAPHRRDRIWFIAHAVSECYGSDKLSSIRSTNEKACRKGVQTVYNDARSNGPTRNVTNTVGIRLQKRSKTRDIQSEKGKAFKKGGKSAISIKTNGGRYYPTNWENFPTVAPICNGNDGLPEKLDGITFPKWRNESIKAGGNAIVPQVALQIFKAINEFENLTRGQG